METKRGARKKGKRVHVSSVVFPAGPLGLLSEHAHVSWRPSPQISRDAMAPASQLPCCIVGGTLWENESLVARIANTGER